MKFKSFAAAAALACMTIASPAMAQGAPAAGDTVYGPDGAAVGTVEQVDGTNVVINTGSMTATLPANVFAEGESGPTIGWNKADLEAAIAAANQEAAAAMEAALVAGTQLHSADGVVVGTVKELSGADMVVVEHTSAGPIQLPKQQMTMQQGKLTFLATAADLEAAVSSQASTTQTATAETGGAEAGL